MAYIEEKNSTIVWLKPIIKYIVFCLVFLSVFRMGLVIWQHTRVSSLQDVVTIFLQGVRFDVISVFSLIVLPLLVTPLMLSIKYLAKFWAKALYWYSILIVVAIAFMELATPSFIAEYDVRPNYLFVEYLKYPKEILSMLFTGYKLPVTIAFLCLPIVVLLGKKSLDKDFTKLSETVIHPKHILWQVPLILIIGFVGIRSSLDHRPANPSDAAFSNDPLLNTLPLNSLYTTAYAMYEKRYESAELAYGDVSEAEANAHIRKFMHINEKEFINPEIPTLHYQKASREFDTPLNLIIVLEESLGAEFVGSLGGLDLTPNIDSFANQGLWFEKLYATGTRSVRGIEAVTTGFLPSTSKSVVKLSKSQSNFFTIADLLGRKSYDTSFIYGGSANFDNMRRFFSNNGFDKIIEEKDYKNPSFKGSWGVSDEDLFNKAHKYFEQQSQKKKPFFSLVFSSTNHTPFEFPDNKIELYDKEKNTVNNAVKYADYAVGEFVKKAKASSYWENTLILVISDHNSRVYGSELVPIKRFHIPGVILGGSIKPQKNTRIVSQIDMIPTLLSLMGIDAFIPTVGYDLTRKDIDLLPERAIMQFNNTQAYMKGKDVVVQRKNMPASQFKYINEKLVAAPLDIELKQEALLLSAWPFYSYQEQTYHLQD